MNLDSMARRQMACLGDASRYRIVSELATGQACVTELAGRIGLSQSCTTRHLQALVRAGLVSRQRAGRRVLFSVRSTDPAVRSLLDWKLRLETDAEFQPPSTSGRDPDADSDVGEDPVARTAARVRPSGRPERGIGVGSDGSRPLTDEVDRGSTGAAGAVGTPFRVVKERPTLGSGNDRSEEAGEEVARDPRRNHRDLEDYLL